MSAPNEGRCGNPFGGSGVRRPSLASQRVLYGIVPRRRAVDAGDLWMPMPPTPRMPSPASSFAPRQVSRVQVRLTGLNWQRDWRGQLLD
jgi:hypothetical protein